MDPSPYLHSERDLPLKREFAFDFLSLRAITIFRRELLDSTYQLHNAGKKRSLLTDISRIDPGCTSVSGEHGILDEASADKGHRICLSLPATTFRTPERRFRIVTVNEFNQHVEIHLLRNGERTEPPGNRHYMTRRQGPSSQGWKTFLRNHAAPHAPISSLLHNVGKHARLYGG
jgi:hypothetical protein